MHPAAGLEPFRGAASRVVLECTALDDTTIRTGVYWLAAEAEKRGLDAVIVLPTLGAAKRFLCALPLEALRDLVDGNIVRMNHGSLLLMTPREVMPQWRCHQVVLAVGLARHELERVERMRPAALCVVRRTRDLPTPLRGGSVNPLR
jgi:hypothetical protein